MTEEPKHYTPEEIDRFLRELDDAIENGRENLKREIGRICLAAAEPAGNA